MLSNVTLDTGLTRQYANPHIGSIDWQFWHWHWHPDQDSIRNAFSINTYWREGEVSPAYYKVWQRLPWHDDEYHTFTEWTLHSTQEVADLIYDLVNYA